MYGPRSLIIPLRLVIIALLLNSAESMAHVGRNELIQPELWAWVSPDDEISIALFQDPYIPSWPAEGHRFAKGESLTVQTVYDFVWFSSTGATEDPTVEYRGTLEAWFEVLIRGVNQGSTKTSPTWAWACSSSARLKAPPVRHFHDPEESGCNSISCFVVDLPLSQFTPSYDQGPSNWVPDTVWTIAHVDYEKGAYSVSFLDTTRHLFFVLDSLPEVDPHECDFSGGQTCYSLRASPPPVGWGETFPGKPLADPGYPRENSHLLEAAPNGDVEVGQPRILITSENAGSANLFTRGDFDGVFTEEQNIHYYPVNDSVYLKSGFDIFVLWMDTADVHVEMVIDTFRTSDGTWQPYAAKGKYFLSANYLDEPPAYVVWDSLRLLLPGGIARSQEYRCIVSDTIFSPTAQYVTSDRDTSHLRVHWMDAIDVLDPESCFVPGDTLDVNFVSALPFKGYVSIYLERNCSWETVIDSIELEPDFDDDTLWTWRGWEVDTDTVDHWARLRVELISPREQFNGTPEMSDTSLFFPILPSCDDIFVKDPVRSCFEPGDTLRLHWDASPYDYDSVYVYLLRNGQWETIDSIPNGTAPDFMNTQLYKWVVNTPTSASCRIRVDLPGGGSDTTSYFEIKANCSGGGGGCPYVYAWNGADYVQDNTILSGSGDSSFVEDRYFL